MEFQREGSAKVGRQSQTWLRVLPDGKCTSSKNSLFAIVLFLFSLRHPCWLEGCLCTCLDNGNRQLSGKSASETKKQEALPSGHELAFHEYPHLQSTQNDGLLKNVWYTSQDFRVRWRSRLFFVCCQSSACAAF